MRVRVKVGVICVIHITITADLLTFCGRYRHVADMDFACGQIWSSVWLIWFVADIDVIHFGNQKVKCQGHAEGRKTE